MNCGATPVGSSAWKMQSVPCVYRHFLVAGIGIVGTSCAATLYPSEKKLLWQPYALLDAVRRHEDNSGARAGVAFASIAFMLSQVGMVVACNSVIVGIDLAALIPR